MKSSARAARAARREMIRAATAERRAFRAVADAVRTVADGGPVTAKTFLIAAGVSAEDAQRFAGAFSRGVKAEGKVARVMRVRRKAATQANHYAVIRCTTKTYELDALRARLAVYRPKSDPTAAARFETAACYTLAA